MMDSTHFYLVVLDFEGKVVKFNRSFERVGSKPLNLNFCDFLFPKSASDFNCSLDQMLGSPKSVRHLLLDHKSTEANAFSKVWWEFSVVTTPDMDLSGIIGVGVDVRFLEQEMPWDNLVDVLGFGKIELNSDFRIRSWDGKIGEWFYPEVENWHERPLMDLETFQGFTGLSDVLRQISAEGKPKCFQIQTNNFDHRVFAALITTGAGGYELFLVPKVASNLPHSAKSLLPAEVLSALPGAVFVLDKKGKLSQQNEAAKNLGRIWKGRAYSEGHALTFPNQPNRFSKLLRAIEDSKRGESTELELRLLMPDQEFEFWSASVRPISAREGGTEGILIQVVDLTHLKLPLMQTNRENERLRELALSPSHILRGPLSSIIGLLELIDSKQLDKENRKLFGFLKPLTKELDQIIRQHAKKMSTFD